MSCREAVLLGEASYVEGIFSFSNKKYLWSVFYKYTLSFLVTSAPRLFVADIAEL